MMKFSPRPFPSCRLSVLLTTYALEEFLQLNLTVKHYESTGQTGGLPVFELIAHLALAAGDPHRYAPH